MIISVDHKFILLSNRKCGSTSLVHSLENLPDMMVQKDYRLRHTNYKDYQQFIRPWLQKNLKDDLDDFKVISVFREPLDWVFSWYRFRRSAHLQQVDNPDFSTRGISWHTFLKNYLIDPENRPSYARVSDQADFVIGEDGTVDGITLFAYDKFDDLVLWLKNRIGQDFELKQFNVSDTINQKPSERDYNLARQYLTRDYEIYESIT